MFGTSTKHRLVEDVECYSLWAVIAGLLMAWRGIATEAVAFVLPAAVALWVLSSVIRALMDDITSARTGVAPEPSTRRLFIIAGAIAAISILHIAMVSGGWDVAVSLWCIAGIIACRPLMRRWLVRKFRGA